MNIPPSRQCLVFEGKQLEDDRTLADLVVLADASLTEDKLLFQNVKIHSTDSTNMNGRGGNCAAVDRQTGLFKVALDPDRVNPSCRAPPFKTPTA